MFHRRLRLIVYLVSMVALFASFAPPAVAQQPLSLRIRDGRVTLQARNVTVRQILSEWARIGGTRIVNMERVGGGPLTLDLNDVPERQALDILLRNVAGYVLGARSVPAPSGSVIDRILILATSTAPAARPPGPQTFTNGPATRVPRPVPQPAPPQPEIDPTDPEENPPDDAPPSDEPVQPRILRPGTRRPGVGTVVAPFGQAQPDPPGADEDGTGGVVIIGPSNPFGIPAGSSQTPGTIAPVPPNQPQGAQEPD